MPSGTFLHSWLRHLSFIESPLSYDFWSGIWLQSSITGRGTTVARPRIPVYLNVYVILVAESGHTRKSTVISQAQKMLRLFIDNEDEKQRNQLITVKTIPEDLELQLHNMTRNHGYARASICISELVTFLGRERYQIAMPGLLTDLYDSPSIRAGGGTIRRGETVIKDVYLTFMSASTPTWLEGAINPDVIEGGFTSRVLFIVEEERKKKVAWPSNSMSEDFDRALDRLQHTRRWIDRQRIAELELDNSAIRYLKQWYDSKPESQDTFSRSFESREDDHMLRLAGHLALNEHRAIVLKNDLQASVQIINEAKTRGSQIFIGARTDDRTLAAIEAVAQRLRKSGEDMISRTEVLQPARRHMSAMQLDKVLRIMVELKLAQTYLDRRDNPGRPAEMYRGTALLEKRNWMKMILDRM
jgi:hypothetical protein